MAAMRDFICVPWAPLERMVCAPSTRHKLCVHAKVVRAAPLIVSDVWRRTDLCVSTNVSHSIPGMCFEHRDELAVRTKMSPHMTSIVWNDTHRDFLCAHTHMAAVGIEPMPVWTGAWSQRLKPLGQLVMMQCCTLH